MLPGPKNHAVVQLFNYWTRPQAFIEKCRKEYGPVSSSASGSLLAPCTS
ncbi:hypothetical protein NKH18_14590 [Streptomyces sp. M10(2022)]